MNGKWFLGYLLLVTQLFFLGCARTENAVSKSAGLKIPADEKVTSLSEVLKNPEVYHQKKVLLEGIFVGACPSLCDFTFQDGVNTITMYPKGFKLPKIQKRQRIRVYTEITVGKERVVVSALGLEEVPE